MPDPASTIPSAQPADLATALATATAPPALVGALKFKPSVSEVDFLKYFPLPYKVEAVTIYEAARQGFPTDRSFWQFLGLFRYVSPTWGPIDIPKGFYTDFASVPPKLHSIIDDDS